MTTQTILWRGHPLAFTLGDTVAMALTRAGIDQYGTRLTGLDAALFCGIGQCQNCLVAIKGQGVAEACLTLCEPDLAVSPVREAPHD
ncbi:2Fe-2S iron-sulfur cluster-binding protein [Celeribacter baekdonensis]|uniref:Ferredoxin n=1 Tax=Celeribacter baekdonensis TaxID=875171 RepID=A0A2R4M4R1_9RHOB|nr:2Fe-2S iron-sulfur cluster-binding protein [Celeribacter baekdonensis]AVW92143.1 ferredoxin [Celeribacter baekdonensis]|tara:strand:- start:7953 stop:8213 length:261 start_codon:yes stop_codon:yes gene_type:complete